MIVKLTGSWGKKAIKGEDPVQIKSTVYTENKKCLYVDKLQKKIKLPRACHYSEEALELIADKNKFLIKEPYIDKTSDQPKFRYILTDALGSIDNVFYNIEPEVLFKDGFTVGVDTNVKKDLINAEESTEENAEPYRYLLSLDKGRLTENFNEITAFGDFYKASRVVKDDYGPLFNETQIINRDGKVLYSYTDNIEKPVEVTLTPDKKALFVEEYLKHFVVNASGAIIDIPKEVNPSFGYNLVWYENMKKVDNERVEFAGTYSLINITTLGKKIVGNNDKSPINALAPNVYEVNKEKREYFINDIKITDDSNIKRIDRVISDSPLLLSCAVIPPKDVKDVGDYFALFKLEGSRLKKVSKDFTEIITDEGLYYPLENVFYARNRRENTEGGFYFMIDYTGRVILDEKWEIVEVGPKGLKMKGKDFNMIYNAKTKSLIPDGFVAGMVGKDLAGYEKKQYNLD